MKYFQVDASSAHFCGFDSSFYFEAESESDLENSKDWSDMEDHMYDYVSGYCDENDYEEHGDEADLILYNITETTKEEYDLYNESNFV